MSFEKDQIWRALTDTPGNYYCQSTDIERQFFKDWLLAILRDQTVTVDFNKTNGDFRSMTCTLNESLGARYSSNESKKKSNPDVCVVWDINQNAWRSFRWDRIKNIKIDLG